MYAIRSYYEGIKDNLPLKPAITFVPIGSETNFRGVVNVINQKAYVFDDKGKAKESEIRNNFV